LCFPLSRNVLELLQDKAKGDTSPPQPTLGQNAELYVARDTRHICCYDEIDRVIIASCKVEHAIELGPVPIAPGQAWFIENLDQIESVLRAKGRTIGSLLLSRCHMLCLFGSRNANI